MAIAVPTDVGIESQCKRLIDATVAEYGRIDTLINNAGYGLQGKFEKLPDLNRFRALINDNLLGCVYCTYYALPHLMRTEGRIVAVSSVSGKIGSPGSTAYCASKFGMAGFFDALRLELKEHHVSVTVIYPGFVVTEFAERVVKPDGTPVGEEGRKMYNKYMMSAETCASIIINTAAGRKRSAVLSLEGKIGVWLNNNFPGIVDNAIVSFFKTRKKRL
jgi:short-subunit dehydrogenase